jgi:predicted dehydrogenase
VKRPPLGIGIIGLGRWGRNYVATLDETPGCRLVAVADPAAGDAQHIARRHSSAEAMLCCADVDAVVVATPDATHFDLALCALESGRHVLVEKPMALQTAHAERLVEEAARRELVLAVGHTPLYHSNHLQLRAACAAAAGPAELHLERTSRGPAEPTSSVVLDLGPHDLAIVIALMGQPLALRGEHLPDSAARAAFAWQAEFDDGSSASGRLAWTDAPASRFVELRTARGTQRFTETSTPHELPLSALCRDFIDACIARRAPKSDGRLGLEVTRSLAALERSSALGGSWQRPAPARPEPVAA